MLTRIWVTAFEVLEKLESIPKPLTEGSLMSLFNQLENPFEKFYFEAWLDEFYLDEFFVDDFWRTMELERRAEIVKINEIQRTCRFRLPTVNELFTIGNIEQVPLQDLHAVSQRIARSSST